MSNPAKARPTSHRFTYLAFSSSNSTPNAIIYEYLRIHTDLYTPYFSASIIDSIRVLHINNNM